MTHVRRLVTVLVMAGSVAACALGSGSSYVDRVVTPADAKVLAGAMAEFVAGRLPAGSSAVILDPTPSEQAANALTPAFVAALRDRGFAVADASQVGAPHTHRIRYLVTRLDNGNLLRVTIEMVPLRRHASLSATAPATCKPAARSRYGRWREQING